MSDQQKFSRKDMEELARFIEGKDDKDPNRFKNIVDNFIKNCKQERESINVESISASVNTVDGCIILNTIDSHAVESKEVGVSCSIKYSKPIKSK